MSGDEADREEALGRAYDARLMRRLLAYLRPHRRLAWAALALMLVSSATQLVGPLATSVAIDLYLTPAALHAQGGAAEAAVRSGNLRTRARLTGLHASPWPVCSRIRRQDRA